MCHFILRRLVPVLIGLAVIACIDVPNNPIRWATFAVLDSVREHLGSITVGLN